MRATHRTSSRFGSRLAASLALMLCGWSGLAQAAPGEAPLLHLGALSPRIPVSSPAAQGTLTLSLPTVRPPLAKPSTPASPLLRLTLDEGIVPAPQPGAGRLVLSGAANFGGGAFASRSSGHWYSVDPSSDSVQAPGSPSSSDAWTTNQPQRDRPAKGKDQRSLWARWNSSLWGVSATMALAAGSMIGAFTALPPSVTGWESPQFEGLKGNFTSGPRFDNDKFYFNYVAHPLAGSEYYLAARNRGCTWWQSLAYSAAASGVFEFFMESLYERASWQDLFITPVSGAVLGEIRWQAKKALESPSEKKPIGTLNKILYVVVDPMDAVYKL